MREYERAMTTVMSRVVGPVMAGTSPASDERLAELGIAVPDRDHGLQPAA